MLARQKIFYRITEAFDADAECMPAHLRSRPDSVFVQFVSGCPLFKRQMQIDHAPGTHPRSAMRQSSAPLPPLLAVKLFEIFERKLLAHRLACVHVREQLARYGIAEAVEAAKIAGIAELLNPLLHHLHVTQLTERPEKLSASLLHVLPRRIGIERNQSIGERTAASQRDSKIVHWIGIEPRSRQIALHQHAFHPGAQAEFRLRDRGHRTRWFQRGTGCHWAPLIAETIVASLSEFF